MKKLTTNPAKTPKSSAVVETAGKGLVPYSADKKPPTRVKDMKSLHDIYLRFLQDDRTSSYNRALVRDAAEGAPPYDNADIEQDGRFNLNFHDLSALLDERNAVYTDLIDSVPTLIRPFFAETVDDAGSDDREDKQDIIAEEHTQLIRNDWLEFYTRWELLTSERSQHGVSLAYFEDEVTWEWNATGWDGFLLPRQVEASEEAIDVMFIRNQRIPLHRFYKYIKDEAAATVAGWKVDAAKRALVLATTGSSSKARTWQRSWGEVQDELAGNDFGKSYATTDDVKVVHALVREIEGQISHYIMCEDGSGTDFLFAKRNRYDDSSQAFTIFTANVGRNGKFHAVRGDLYRAYPQAQALNRIRCSTLDNVAISLTLMLQPPDAESMEDMALVINGPVTWVPPEATALSERTFPNLSQGALPMIQQLASGMRENLGMARTESMDQANTKYGQQFQQLSMGALTGAQVARFYRSWRRLLQEQFRRIQAIGANNPKFPEIKEFYRRLALRGVSEQEVRLIERVEPYRAAGNGSVGHRMMAYDKGQQTIGQLDEVGRARYVRDSYTEQFGPDLANRYVGKPQKPRFLIDARIATLENADLANDPSIVPMPGENDFVHTQTHLSRAAQEVDGVMQVLTAKGSIDPTPAITKLDYVQALLGHTQAHLQAFSQDPTRKQQFGDMSKAFQQIAARWKSMADLAARLTPTQQDQQDHLSRMQMSVQEHQLKMQQTAEAHQQQMQLKQADVGQKMNLRKVTTGAKLAIQNAEKVGASSQ